MENFSYKTGSYKQVLKVVLKLPDSIVPLLELSSDFCVQFVMLSLNLVLVRDDLIGNADRRVVTVVSVMMNLK